MTRKAFELVAHAQTPQKNELWPTCEGPCPHRWAQFDCDLQPLCSPFGGCCAECNGEAGWAQNWAQCRNERNYSYSVFQKPDLTAPGLKPLLSSRDFRGPEGPRFHQKRLYGIFETSSRQEPLQLAENNEGTWRARRDSNSRPIAPEAIALSN